MFLEKEVRVAVMAALIIEFLKAIFMEGKLAQTMNRRQLVSGLGACVGCLPLGGRTAFGYQQKKSYWFNDGSIAGIQLERQLWLQKQSERIGRQIADPKGIASKRFARYQIALKKYTNGAALQKESIRLTMPDIAENSEVVPFSAIVDHSVEAVAALYLFAPLNPFSEVGQFYFSAASGRAYVSGRMRVAMSQDIVAVAKMKTGRFFTAQKFVAVTMARDCVGEDNP